VGLKVMNPGNMEFLLGHISAARMSAKTLLLNWGVLVDVMHGVDMDKLIGPVLTFKKDHDGKFWLKANRNLRAPRGDSVSARRTPGGAPPRWPRRPVGCFPTNFPKVLKFRYI
jgi:hypothetical protein